MSDPQQIAVVGAGIFGVTAALALRRRGHAVVLLDPGPLPHPLAASTDISKAVRMEYGADCGYTALMEQALDGWHRWNESFSRPLFHEVGVLFLKMTELAPGSFEGDSLATLLRRGHRPERITAEEIRRRFPAWNTDRFPVALHHGRGGYAEAARVVAELIARAQEAGVLLRAGQKVVGLEERGIWTEPSGICRADQVVLTTGAWTAGLLPELAEELLPHAQPIFHLKPADPSLYEAARFPVFGADIARLGYYGFPANAEGIVKIAHHGAGRSMAPDDPARTPAPEQEEALRAFLREALPGLYTAPIVHRHLCLYCDTWDGHFLIDRHPQRRHLVVAAGGSGHAFKFAPVLGDLIADVVEERAAPLEGRFRWRTGVRPARSQEAARAQS